MGKWDSDEQSLLRGKGDGNVQVSGLSALINAEAISFASSIRQEHGGPSIVTSSVSANDWR